jgi:hypothetical protein
MKTPKAEDVDIGGCETFQDVAQRLPRFIEEVYNAERLCRALGIGPPDKFERQLVLHVAWFWPRVSSRRGSLYFFPSAAARAPRGSVSARRQTMMPMKYLRKCSHSLITNTGRNACNPIVA